MNRLDDPVVRAGGFGQPIFLEEADQGQQETDDKSSQRQAKAAAAHSLHYAQRPERDYSQNTYDDVYNLQGVCIACPEYDACDEIEQYCDPQYHYRDTCH